MNLSHWAVALTCVAMPLSSQTSSPAISDSLPGQRVRWELVRIPAGRTIDPGTGTSVLVPAFWIGRTEVPWELYDIFYLRFDIPRADRASIDATTRPSKPYGAPDRGYGHRGYPAISLTHRAVVDFAAWLSGKTGHTYAVPTEAQWQRAAELSVPRGTVPATVAWAADVAEGTTHPVAALAPDALGLYDLFGNAGEWVTSSDGSGRIRGGTFLDRRDSVSARTRATQQPSWNKTDPQIPKSRWWLSDGPFAGIRLVRIP
ncbi:MAG: SUMF1/EgtB/PvdO family nonheme iron enzyme [Gemmatimonadota bacterium]